MDIPTIDFQEADRELAQLALVAKGIMICYSKVLKAPVLVCECGNVYQDKFCRYKKSDGKNESAIMCDACEATISEETFNKARSDAYRRMQKITAEETPVSSPESLSRGSIQGSQARDEETPIKENTVAQLANAN